MSIQQIINQLPDEAKRSVLYSLVGTINASMVGTAASVVSRLERDDYDVKELEISQIEILLGEADGRQDLLLHTRRLAAVGVTLRDQLIELTNDNDQGAVSASIDFMTRPNNARDLDADLLAKTLEAAGITNIDTGHLNAMNKARQLQRAERLAGQRGAIEFVIDQLFVPPTDTEVHYEEEEREDGTKFSRAIETHHDVDVQIEELPEEMRERLNDKLLAALDRARDNAILGVMSRDRRFTFGDVSLITAAIEDANNIELDVHVPVLKKGKKSETVVA